MPEQIRTFDTGANRNSDEGKLDYEGFLHPLVLQQFALYMDRHRFLQDGTVRDSANWTKGIPMDSTMKSGWRHFHDWWLEHRGYESREGIKDALCGLLFNVQSYLLSVLEAEEQERVELEYQKTPLYTELNERTPYEKGMADGLRADVEKEVAEAYPELTKPTILQSIPWLKSLVGKG